MKQTKLPKAVIFICGSSPRSKVREGSGRTARKYVTNGDLNACFAK